MLKFYGEACPVCNEKLKEGDDIVVCPECGTPYHRACWAKAGACVHEAEHAAGFEWQPHAAAGGAAAASICPNCGAHNAPGAVYCDHCGVPLPRDGADAPGPDAKGGPVYARGGYAPREQRPPQSAPQAPRAGEGAPRMAAYTAGEDGGIYRREIGPDDPIDGIKARDWASFVGRSSPYYLMQFFRMSTTRQKLGMSFSVLLFGPAYFFYRKMWREGFLYAGLLLLLALPNSLLWLLEAGVLPAASWNVNLLITVADVCYIASWVLTVGMCLFAVYLYKQSATKRIREIYANVPEGPARADALAMTGGTNLLAGALYMVFTAVCTMGLMALMGPQLQAMLNSLAL